MLSVGRLRNTKDDSRVGEKIENSFYIVGGGGDINDLPDFSADNLLDSIDFDDLFVDVLPDLEMGSESEIVNYNNITPSASSTENNHVKDNIISTKEDNKVSDSGSEILSNRETNKGKKSSKNHHQGKRKVKVDWTPELHRRFVQVVEQLGVDKAVPSRILELMGIDYCLTRHNIASHLQKYRSHRKHLLAREAEAASWSQRRQMYSGGVGLEGCKREIISNPNWFNFTPTVGFSAVPHFRPLHVWGHPSMDQRHIWPKHNFPTNSPPTLLWPAPAAAAAAAAPHLQQVPNSVPHQTPCFQPPTQTTNFPNPAAVPAHPPHAMYKADTIAAVPSTPPIDFHPSKESIDAALEDVLTKPWLPLPLGLKPPSTDSVVVELHRQGIHKIPPNTSFG